MIGGKVEKLLELFGIPHSLFGVSDSISIDGSLSTCSERR